MLYLLNTQITVFHCLSHTSVLNLYFSLSFPFCLFVSGEKGAPAVGRISQ